jgi:hypothetical protein
MVTFLSTCTNAQATPPARRLAMFGASEYERGFGDDAGPER